MPGWSVYEYAILEDPPCGVSGGSGGLFVGA